MISTNEISIGATLGPLAVGPITRTTLALFAGASGDHNPIHIDSDVARSAGLDDVFAHGMLGMAQLARVLTGWVPQHAIKSYRVRFAAITPVNSNPTCTGTVVATNDGFATLELTVTLDDGTVTLTGDATIDISKAISRSQPTDQEMR